MSETITLALRVEDAEPILREAAREAAEFGALLDHMTRKTRNMPYRGMGESYDDARKGWHRRFIKAKRVVEAFGVEYEPTTDTETLTVDYHYIGGARKVHRLPGIGPVGIRTGSQPDYKHPFPTHRRGVHGEACRHAADRVVRRWREMIQAPQAA